MNIQPQENREGWRKIQKSVILPVFRDSSIMMIFGAGFSVLFSVMNLKLVHVNIRFEDIAFLRV